MGYFFPYLPKFISDNNSPPSRVSYRADIFVFGWIKIPGWNSLIGARNFTQPEKKSGKSAALKQLLSNQVGLFAGTLQISRPNVIFWSYFLVRFSFFPLKKAAKKNSSPPPPNSA